MQDYDGQRLTSKICLVQILRQCVITLWMRNKTVVPPHVQGSLQGVIHLGALFIPPASMRLASPLSTLCTPVELIQSLVFHTVAEAGTLAPTCEATTGKPLPMRAGSTPASFAPAVFES